MGPGAKVLLALCAVAGAGSLLLALDDPTRWGTWLTLFGIVLGALSILMQTKRDDRRGDEE